MFFEILLWCIIVYQVQKRFEIILKEILFTNLLLIKYLKSLLKILNFIMFEIVL